MKGDRYTTFGVLPLHTVFRYVPDHAGLGPRVKVDEHLCCKPEFYRAHGGNPTEDVLTEAAWKMNSGVYPAEENTRVRVTLADRNLFRNEAARVAALLAEVERLRAEVSYLRACVPPTRPTDYGHEAWTEALRAAVAEERAAVVAWLRARDGGNEERVAVEAYLAASGGICLDFANDIERGEHREEEK